MWDYIYMSNLVSITTFFKFGVFTDTNIICVQATKGPSLLAQDGQGRWLKTVCIVPALQTRLNTRSSSVTGGKSVEPPSQLKSARSSLQTTSTEQCSRERIPGTVCSASLKPYFEQKRSTSIGLDHCLSWRGPIPKALPEVMCKTVSG
jgi:hypothetical protein